MTVVGDEVRKYAQETFKRAWSNEDSDEVPTESDALGLGNQGVLIDAVVLYADLVDSTGLVSGHTTMFAAEVYKAYVYAAAKSVRAHYGSVTAYDGDRVMGVFVGENRRNNAVDAALHIDAMVEDILNPELKAVYSTTSFRVQSKIGIDASQLLVANTGIRGNNDYVWVGNAANNAAKMAGLKLGYTTYITQDVHASLTDANKTTYSGTVIWKDLGTGALGYRIYGANAKKLIV